MSSKDVIKNITLGVSNLTTSGQTIELSSCSSLSLTVVLSVSAATLQAVLKLSATNDDARATDTTADLPALINGVAITALPTGITLPATGLLTFNNPAIGFYEVTIAYPQFPKWVRPVWTFTSGGGTVDARITVASWSV